MRRVLVDADAFVRLASIGRERLLAGLDGRPEMPTVVQVEVDGEAPVGALERATAGADRWLGTCPDPDEPAVERAIESLGRDADDRSFDGGVELLAAAMAAGDATIVTDDAPLRRAARALGIPTAGALGVVVAAATRGALARDEARNALVGLDAVGPRVTAGVYRRAERLIEGGDRPG